MNLSMPIHRSMHLAGSALAALAIALGATRPAVAAEKSSVAVGVAVGEASHSRQGNWSVGFGYSSGPAWVNPWRGYGRPYPWYAPPVVVVPAPRYSCDPWYSYPAGCAPAGYGCYTDYSYYRPGWYGGSAWYFDSYRWRDDRRDGGWREDRWDRHDRRDDRGGRGDRDWRGGGRRMESSTSTRVGVGVAGTDGNGTSWNVGASSSSSTHGGRDRRSERVVVGGAIAQPGGTGWRPNGYGGYYAAESGGGMAIGGAYAARNGNSYGGGFSSGGGGVPPSVTLGYGHSGRHSSYGGSITVPLADPNARRRPSDSARIVRGRSVEYNPVQSRVWVPAQTIQTEQGTRTIPGHWEYVGHD